MSNQFKGLSLSSLAKLVRKKKNTLILCHQNPDPDTLGSAFALKELLYVFGSLSRVACCDVPSKKFNFITLGEDLSYHTLNYERIIAVDVASPSQLGKLDFLAKSVDITIDHHEMNTRFSPYYEDFRASNCENIYLLAKKMKALKKLPKHFFECVYAGMSSDTGGFKYSNVKPETMSVACEVLKSEIDHAEINRIMFDSKTIEEIKAQRLTYEIMKLYCDNALSVAMFTKDFKKENGINDEDISDAVNHVRGIEGVLVAITIKQSFDDERKFFISSRSNVEIDVSSVCASIGGGGHKRAAGASIFCESPEEALELVVDLFSKAVEEFKKS
ncbi:MAG: DHH family phosphoesterase [Clostridia bacterium]|nr:DHH family phosphoesterase [Clostridia bacterium]